MRKFEISQKFWSLAGKFDIFDEDSRLAYQVQGSFLKLFKEFTILMDKERLSVILSSSLVFLSRNLW